MCGMTTCVYVYICVCRYMCTYACEGQRLTISSFLIAFCFIHWGRVFQSSRVLTDRAGLARLLAPRTPISAFPGLELCGYWGSELGSSCVHDKCLTCWAVSPPPISCSFSYPWYVGTAAGLHYSAVAGRVTGLSSVLSDGTKGKDAWRSGRNIASCARIISQKQLPGATPLQGFQPQTKGKKVSSMARVGTWGLIFFFF